MPSRDEIRESLHDIIQRAQVDDDILAIVVFGSYARNEQFQDVDIALMVWPERLAGVNALRKEMEYSEPWLDVSIYQLLPLYIQREVVRDGNFLLIKDEDMVYDIVFWTLREWDDFQHRYYLYLEGLHSEGKSAGQA